MKTRSGVRDAVSLLGQKPTQIASPEQRSSYAKLLLENPSAKKRNTQFIKEYDDLPRGRHIVVLESPTKRGNVREEWSFLIKERRAVQVPKVQRFPRTIRWPRLPGVAVAARSSSRVTRRFPRLKKKRKG